MGDPNDPLNRPSLRRRRFTEGANQTAAARLRDELPTAPVIVESESGDGIDEEVRRRCEVILEQVAEINGLLTRYAALPADYADECRDRLVGVSRTTEEILESLAMSSRQPRSMSAWRLRIMREGRSALEIRHR